MSDTPTTELVRKAYVHAYAPQQFFGPVASADRASLGDDFDRWLAAHDAELREQIAREIETRQWAVASTHHFGFGEHGWTCLCGFKSPVNRQRTEHIIAEIDADRIARGEKP